jgi:hypothetical protein
MKINWNRALDSIEIILMVLGFYIPDHFGS